MRVAGRGFIPSPASGRGLGRGAMVKFVPSRGCPTASYFTFACSKESNQRKEHPLPWPTASLRYSTIQAAAELAALLRPQGSSPTSLSAKALSRL